MKYEKEWYTCDRCGRRIKDYEMIPFSNHPGGVRKILRNIFDPKTREEMTTLRAETAHGYRGAEIHQWLNEWTGEAVERFVILDDNIDMKPYMDRLVWTDFKYGLSKRVVKRAVKLLGEKDYASDIAKKIKADLLHGIKPKDCKYCYGASDGAMGVHYSCGCEKSMRYEEYPLVMCPKDCKHYVKESENGL